MPSETVDQYHTRLRGLAKYCDFHDTDFDIKMQIVCNGTSSRLVDGRKAEISTAQASGIEEQFKELQVNEIKTSSRKCYYCGLGYPHNDRPCPAKSSTCASCGVKGHFAKVCRSSQKHDKQKQQTKTQKFTRKVRTKTDKSKPYRPTKSQAGAITVKSEVSDSDTGSTDSDYVYAVQKQENATHGVKKTTLKINNKQVQFLVDTGATVDLVDSKTYELLRNQVTLHKSNTKIYAYGATKPLPLTGQFQATIESKTPYTVSQFYVVEGTGGNLLSAKTAQDLSLIKMVNTITQMPSDKPKEHQPQEEQLLTSPDTCQTPDNTHKQIVKSSDPNIQTILDKYSTVFVGEGKLRVQQIKLHIRTDVHPVMQSQRRIPYHMRKEVSKELIRKTRETGHNRKSC